jgi:hypothetical protein
MRAESLESDVSNCSPTTESGGTVTSRNCGAGAWSSTCGLSVRADVDSGSGGCAGIEDGGGGTEDGCCACAVRVSAAGGTDVAAGVFTGVEGFACATGTDSGCRGFGAGAGCGTAAGAGAGATGAADEGTDGEGAGPEAGFVPASLSSITASVASTAPVADGVVDGGVTTLDFAGATGWREARYAPVPAAPPRATSAINPTATLLLSIP